MTTTTKATQDKEKVFGARPYLMNAFGLDKHVASDVLTEWMNTFSERHPS